MGWIFIAYFLTILVFAGFYLALNRAGGYFSHESKDGGGGGAAVALSNSYFREGRFYHQIAVGDAADGAIDQSYCGMDINNNMEGKLSFSMRLCTSNVFSPPSRLFLLQRYTSAFPQWQQSVTESPTIILETAGDPSF